MKTLSMTKCLPAALLIAGLSVTAKAEPTVYYCNTTKFADVMKDEIQTIKSYPFKLFVDWANDKIKIAGEFAEFEASGDQVTPWSVLSTEKGENAFFGSTISRTFDFQNNILGYSTVTSNQNGELFVRGIIARCDKF